MIMKKNYILILLFLFTFNSFSQDKKAVAEIYFKKAKKSLVEKDTLKTEKYLNKAKEFFGGISKQEVSIFGANFFYSIKKHAKSKEYLSAFFKLNKDKSSEEYNSMLLLFTENLDALENYEAKIKVNKKKVEELPVLETKNEDLVNNDVSGVEVMVEEEIVEDVSFMIIEEVPVYPGCFGTKQDLKLCFSKKVQQHFIRKFNADLPNQLGLSAGRKRVLIGFLISKTGEVKNIHTKAPHPKIKEEVNRVMKLLPKMKPGKQRGKDIGVKYNIPFTLIVEGDSKELEKKN